MGSFQEHSTINERILFVLLKRGNIIIAIIIFFGMLISELMVVLGCNLGYPVHSTVNHIQKFK